MIASEPGRLAPAVDIDLPTLAGPFRVNGNDDALAAKAPRALIDQVRRSHGRAVDGHLVGTGQQGRADVVNGADAATDTERDEQRIGYAAHHVEHRIAALVRGRDIQKDQLVGPFTVVDGRLLNRIAGVAQVDEINAFDDPAVLDIEAGDNSFGKHAYSPRAAASASASDSAPVYSAIPITAPPTTPLVASSRISPSDCTPPDAMTDNPVSRARAIVDCTADPVSSPSRETSV